MKNLLFHKMIISFLLWFVKSDLLSQFRHLNVTIHGRMDAENGSSCLQERDIFSIHTAVNSNYLIVILSTQSGHKYDPGDSSHQLGKNNRKPYTVHAKQQRQQEHSPKIKDKCPQKRNQC